MYFSSRLLQFPLIWYPSVILKKDAESTEHVCTLSPKKEQKGQRYSMPRGLTLATSEI